MTPAQERFYMASEWRMVWWKLRRHRVAVVSGVILLVMYVSILFCEFLAPYGLDTRNTDFIYAPPQRVRIFDKGRLVAPFVYGYDYRLDMTNLRAGLHAEPRQARPDPLLLPWRRIPLLGAVSRRPAPDVPGSMAGSFSWPARIASAAISCRE